MHPKKSRAQAQARLLEPNYATLTARSWLDRLHRKIRRSKKLTKLLLKDSTLFQLTSQTDALALNGQIVTILAQQSSVSEAKSLTCIGPELTRVDRPEDLAHFPAIQVLRFQDTQACGRSSLIKLKKNHLIHHDLISPKNHMISEEDHHQLQINAEQLTCQFTGSPLMTATLRRAALFTDSVASNYAHWLTEVLPRIALYVKNECSAGVPLIVDADLHPNLYESLSIVAGPKRTVFKLPLGRRVHIRQLDVVTPTGYVPYAARPPKRIGHSHGIFSKEALWAVRDACKHLMHTAGTGQGKRIFIQRNSSLRKLVNEQQISAVLAASGFTVIAPEDFSFSEQVRLFSQAELVIGATGAAMANLIFCPPGSKVHVLMAQHEDMPYWYWQRMADCIGIDLTYGLGEICAAHENGFHADFTVDIKHIEELLLQTQPCQSAPHFSAV